MRSSASASNLNLLAAQTQLVPEYDEDISEDEEDNYEYTSDDEDEIVPVSPGPARKPHVEVTLEDTDGEEEAEEIIIEKEKEN